jgi:hypothetical protein
MPATLASCPGRDTEISFFEQKTAFGGQYSGVRLENGIYGHSRFCNTDFDDKLACLNLSGV